MNVLSALTKRRDYWKSDKYNNKKTINVFITAVLSIGILVGLVFTWNFYKGTKAINRHIYTGEANSDEIIAPSEMTNANFESQAWTSNCSYWDCFNVYRCGLRDQRHMSIYIYPYKEYLDPNRKGQPAILTKEYYRILETVMQSIYYTPNPNEACVFLPSVDLLNEDLIDVKSIGKFLMSLDYWDNGENHLIFNIFPGNAPMLTRALGFSIDKAIILGSGFSSTNYRTGFDILFPVWSPLLENFDASNIFPEMPRKYLLIAAQRNIYSEHKRIMNTLAKEYPSDLLVLQSCKGRTSTIKRSPKKIGRCNGLKNFARYDYPDILSKSKFCLYARSAGGLNQPDFLEMLAFNCIPVVVFDNILLPFEDVIDWSLAVIRMREIDLPYVIDKLKTISHYRLLEMQHQCEWLFRKYFRDLNTITLTTLELLNERIFPHLAKSNHQWNKIDTIYKVAQNPLFQPMISVGSQGFTAVILTYDRIESLFTLIQKLAVVPSLQSILVIWNNQKKAPPQLSMYPKILKPLRVIQTKANKLSNRFYPYDEIETEAILTIDDDILMLTTDELNFGFEVWREFPDRIVGFPSRIHTWDNATMRWHYESEWTNEISMVLTGAAFHHKYWSYMYTNAMPIEIKNWVDEHMNCEDIAMNFLVANITNKPPIKVTPRKKFKCPECTNTEMLSAYLSHMMERSTCIDRFAQFYGHMPLRTVEFRADPVLYKDNFPEKLKRFNDIGSL